METDLLIGGAAKPATGNRSFDRLNPVTRAIATRAAAAGKADVDAAVAAFATWSKTGPSQRLPLVAPDQAAQ